MLNFAWWVNRKDAEENNIFEGGFLGLDNIGVFDRNMTLGQVADELSHRLTSIFLRDEQSRWPVFGGNMTFQNDEHWRDYVPFHEYFHGENGAGVGARHQTGWTAVVANLFQQRSEGDSTRKTGSASTNSVKTL